MGVIIYRDDNGYQVAAEATNVSITKSGSTVKAYNRYGEYGPETIYIPTNRVVKITGVVPDNEDR